MKNDGIEIKNLSIDGGMAVNKVFCQLLADYLQQDVNVPSIVESTAIGAAITSGLGIKIFSIEELQKRELLNSNIYKPRKKVFDPEDLVKWRKFLSLLMSASN